MPLRILLADDHHIVRQGLRMLLEREGLQVVAEATNGREAVQLAETHKPDVVVLDLMMPLLNGLEAGREILQNRTAKAAILLTIHTQDHQVAAALQAGIRAYILKTQAAEDLVHAIRAVLRGETYLSPAVSSIVVDGYLSGGQPATDKLAPRERQVLQLVAEGKTSKEIAQLLDLTVKTAESYRARLMEKLDLHDTAGLVRYAIRRGIIDP
jgi:two-component system response regulator NreC